LPNTGHGRRPCESGAKDKENASFSIHHQQHQQQQTLLLDPQLGNKPTFYAHKTSQLLLVVSFFFQILFGIYSPAESPAESGKRGSIHPASGIHP
jgi:hypothetical protein